MEIAFAADRRHADAIAVPTDARDHARNQMPGALVVGMAEPQRVQIGHRARAHGEHVAQDAADTGGRPLVGLDKGRVVMALHLEDGSLAVADIDDAGIFARSANHPGCFRRQFTQPAAR